MAVSKRKQQPTEVTPALVKKSSGERFEIMLGNECQRFMTPKPELYIAGKRYSVDSAKRKELFNFYDENGTRYFYDSEVIQKQIEAARRRGRRYAEAEEGMDTADNVTRLEDDEGEPAGTKTGDSVSI